ncbi:hypothetical protein B0H15DRAFT_958203 [Mycena belliarum]|uniref:Uncharacterized protein n=1 Tax=Mycena belliarum TaxID=1033014 RepID=A0AAD6TLE0_9AGAR|nr:hypothetical protein B0H15DRAFT_958203 [Mycena belliae]
MSHYRAESDFVPELVREASRAIADRLLPPERYAYRDRRRSLSPHSHGRSTPDLDRDYGRRSDERYDRRDSYGWRGEREPNRRRYRDDSPPRQYRQQSPAPRYRSPSPRRPYYDRYAGPQRYEDARRGYVRRGRAPTGRGRAPQRDDRVHSSAPNSRPADAPWTRTTFPPDINHAGRDEGGHPILAESEDDGDTSDYGTDETIKAPANYTANESIRRDKAIAAENAGVVYGKIVATLDSNSVGPWASASRVETFEQARNILRWVHRGDAATMDFLKHEMTRLGSDPTIPRTIGEVTLLQYQNQAVAEYKTVVGGPRNPRPKVTNAGRAGFPFQPTIPPVPIATPEAEQDDRAPSSLNSDGESAAGDAPVSRFARLGASAPDPRTAVFLTEDADDDGSSGDVTLASALRAYEDIATNRWPKAMRTADGTLPDEPYAVPHAGDVRAWVTLNKLMPVRIRSGSSIHRARWLDAATRIFSVSGTFDAIASQGDYPSASHDHEHFPFDATNVSDAQVVCWITQHGIDPETTAVIALEGYARARRNVNDGNSDLDGEEFRAGFPTNANAVAEFALHEDDHWDNLRYAPLRDGSTSTYPVHPAGAYREQDKEMTGPDDAA